MRVRMNGYVVNDDYAPIYRRWGYAVMCPSDIRTAIDGNPEGEELVFEVNSPGGSLFCGLEMWTVLRDAKRLKNVVCVAEVQSIAASAASVWISGCDRVAISPVAQVMMHLPSTCTDGDENEHTESLDMLRAGLNSILNAYELKCGIKSTRAYLEALTRRTSWLSAQEALEVGLADEIIDYQDTADPAPQAMVAAVGDGLRIIAESFRGLPSIQDLIAKETALNGGDEGSPGDDPEPVLNAELQADWRWRAELDLAKEKYMRGV